MKELMCNSCKKPLKHPFFLEITSRRKGRFANYTLCRRCLKMKLRELGLEFLTPPPRKKGELVTIWMCDRCHERLATVVVENTYCGEQGFHYTFFFCDTCEAEDTAAYERDLQNGRISWWWRREVRPLYQPPKQEVTHP